MLSLTAATVSGGVTVTFRLAGQRRDQLGARTQLRSASVAGSVNITGGTIFSNGYDHRQHHQRDTGVLETTSVASRETGV